MVTQGEQFSGLHSIKACAKECYTTNAEHTVRGLHNAAGHCTSHPGAPTRAPCSREDWLQTQNTHVKSSHRLRIKILQVVWPSVRHFSTITGGPRSFVFLSSLYGVQRCSTNIAVFWIDIFTSYREWDNNTWCYKTCLWKLFCWPSAAFAGLRGEGGWHIDFFSQFWGIFCFGGWPKTSKFSSIAPSALTTSGTHIFRCICVCVRVCICTCMRICVWGVTQKRSSFVSPGLWCFSFEGFQHKMKFLTTNWLVIDECVIFTTHFSVHFQRLRIPSPESWEIRHDNTLKYATF